MQCPGRAPSCWSLAVSLNLAILLATAGSARAGEWKSGGPFGGRISTVLVDPSTPPTVYVGTSGNGIFKSTDAGGTWIAAKNGLLNPYVLVVALDPATPGTVYAGTQAGLYKSTDAGATWLFAGAGITHANVFSLAVAPGTPAVLYAGTYFGGAFRSNDGGLHWTAINTGLTDLNVLALAVDPATPTTVFAGTTGGLFKSVDSGATWAHADTGLATLNVNALAIEPSTLYAVSAGQVFKSRSAGGTWAAVTTPGTYVQDLVIDPTTPATLYAVGAGVGVLKSTNAGATWAAASTGLPAASSLAAVAVDPSAPARLYAGGNGVYRSTNAGASWAAANDGLTGVGIGVLAVDRSTGTVYAGSNASAGGGVYRSTDLGASWTLGGVPVPRATGTAGVSAILVHPSSPGTLYAGTYLGVFSSADDGDTWIPANNGLTSTFVNAMALDPLVPTRLYVGTEYAGVFRSSNAGGTWEATNTGLTDLQVRALVVDPQTPAKLYAGTFSGGVFRSGDSGATWAAANVGLTDLDITALAVDPSTPSTLYAGTLSGGVFRSTDSGASWIGSGLTASWVTSLAVNASAPATVLAATLRSGLFISSDSGSTWSPDNAGLPASSFQAVAVDPATPPTRYAGGDDSVWQSTAAPPARALFTVTPCRLLDTRAPALPGEPLRAGIERRLAVVGRCGIPASAKALSLNLTVTSPTREGHLRLYPGGTRTPLTSVLNFGVAQTRANSVIAVLGRPGDLALYAGILDGTVHVIVDVSGYFE